MQPTSESGSLHILWTSADPHTARLMVMMYATNSLLHGWWEQVTVIIWGAAAEVAAENTAVREAIQVAQNAGVHFTACSACARQLGVIPRLEELGVEVRPWGEPLTRLIQNGMPLLTI